MSLIIKIAWRNLFRHKGKSIIIGTIIFFAALLMTFGNGVITGLRISLHKNIATRFIGDIVLISTNRENDNILFDNSNESMEVISGYSNIKPFLEKQKNIEKYLPLAVGQGIIIENEARYWSLLVGVQFEDYQKMFDSNVVLVEGRFMTNGERGVLFSKRRRERFYDTQNYWVIPEGLKPEESKLTPAALRNKPNLEFKSNLVFMCVSKNDMNDERLPIKGIISFKDYNYFWGYFCLMDIESFRECFSYLTARDNANPISEEKKKILDMNEDSMDSLFGGNMIEENKTASQKVNISSLLKSRKKENKTADLDSGSYNFIALKLKPGLSLNNEINSLNQDMKTAGIPLRAVPWQKACGQVYDGTNLVSSVISVFIIFLYIVVIIVIMNTLNMAAIERSAEIAMMRSIGSKKVFIGWMFFAETFILSLIFGGIGIFCGNLAVQIVSHSGIVMANDELPAIFFASDGFNPILLWNDIVFCFVELFAFTSIAIIYPIRLATQVKPIEAIAKE